MDPTNTHIQSEPTAVAAASALHHPSPGVAQHQHHQEQRQQHQHMRQAFASFLRNILAKHKDDDDGDAPRELVRNYKTFG
ncbi:hypothetical protein HDU88_008714, partial [Geranomyces variabilis]